MRSLFLTLILGFCHCAHSQPQFWGVSDFVAVAAQAPDVQAKRLEFEASLRELSSSEALFFPTLSLSNSTYQVQQTQSSNSTTQDTAYDSKSLSIQLRQPIYRPELLSGRSQASLKVERARLSYIEAALKAEAELLDVLLRFRIAAMELNLANEKLNNARDELERVRVELGLGRVPKNTKEKFESKVLLAEAEHRLREGEMLRLKNSSLKFKLTPQELTTHSRSMNLEGLPALVNLPELEWDTSIDHARARIDIDSLSNSISAQQKTMLPKLDGVVQFSRSNNNNGYFVNIENESTAAGIILSWEFNLGGSAIQEVSRLNYLYTASEHDVKARELKFADTVAQIKSDYNSVITRLEAFKLQEEFAKNEKIGINLERRLGLKDSTISNQANTDSLKANLDYVLEGYKFATLHSRACVLSLKCRDERTIEKLYGLIFIER